MNRVNTKKASKPLTVALTTTFAVVSVTLIALAYIFGSDPAKVSATIFVAIIPSASVLWLFSSLLACVICKYKGSIPRAAELNLKASCITVALLLLIALFAMFVSVIAFGVHPIETIYQYLQ